jgi:HK97 family phage prohead protease
MNPYRKPVFLSAQPAELGGHMPQFLEATAAGVVTLAVDTAKREVSGIAIPYNEPMNRPHYQSGAKYQTFDPGSIKWRDNAALFYGHDHLNLKPPVGRVASAVDKDAGSHVTARFAKTPKADEVYALATPDDDGKAVLDRFSIGYYEVAGRYDADTDTYHHTEVDAFDASLVPDPQFRSAKVDAVTSRSPGSQTTGRHNMNEAERRRLAELRGMETLTSAEAAELVALAAKEREAQDSTPATQSEVLALAGSIDTLERRMATFGGGGADDGQPNIPYRTYGDFLRAVAAGETTATEFLSIIARAADLEDGVPHVLAYAGGVIADLGNYVTDTWVGELYKRLTASRRVLNAFTTRPLPSTGMNVEYGVEGTDTTEVDEQVAEGEVLA